MSNANLSKETFPLMPIPRLSQELIVFLDQNFPERCAELNQDVPEIFFKSGQRSVVKYLIRIFEEQNENVL
jgi:hypothetical protein